MLVIFLFLRNIPATIIPSLSVPLSLVGALAIMYQLGFSLDNLSLMALTIATGFVVDDAIVVIENIARYLEEGDSPYEAAMKGSAQIGFTIISLTVSLIAVLIPLLFMGDVVGRLFHEFAITLAATIVISAIVSLTLVPMLCAKLLRPQPAMAAKRAADGFFQALTRFYASTLRVVLDHQGVDAGRRARHVPAHRLSLRDDPQGLLSDSGHRRHPGRDPGGARRFRSTRWPTHQQALAKAILADPDVESLSSFIGVDGSNVTLNSGRFLINLKPHDERKATASEIIRRLQQETAERRPASRCSCSRCRTSSIDTAVSATQYQFTLENQDLATAADVDAEGARAARPDPLDRRRRERPPAERPLGDRRSRPRERRALRHHAGDRRQRALRRLRPAHHLDDLHPDATSTASSSTSIRRWRAR